MTLGRGTDARRVARGSFWFVADSQWSRFDEKTGLADTARLRTPTILELPLARSLPPFPSPRK
jgi:hypothetical protein